MAGNMARVLTLVDDLAVALDVVQEGADGAVLGWALAILEAAGAVDRPIVIAPIRWGDSSSGSGRGRSDRSVSRADWAARTGSTSQTSRRSCSKSVSWSHRDGCSGSGKGWVLR